MPGGYGSWNIIGWIILMIPVTVLLLTVRIWLTNLFYAVRYCIDNWFCSRGWHWANSQPLKEVSCLYSPANMDYVLEAHKYFRCRNCLTRIKGSGERLEEVRVSKFDIQKDRNALSDKILGLKRKHGLWR